MSGHVPNLLASFAGSSRQNKTDADIIAHILSGEAFHIISGPQAGKYVYRDARISKYTYVGNGKRRRTELEYTKLDAGLFLQELMKGGISDDALALEGQTKKSAIDTVFLNEVITQGGFEITRGFSSGSYMFEISPDAGLRLCHLVPEISGGQIAGISKVQPRVDLLDLLDSLSQGSFKFGPENTLVFEVARERSNQIDENLVRILAPART